MRCDPLLTNQQQWPFPGRVKRPATDPVNALLSFGYALLTSKMAHAVQVVGFDHYIGYLHSTIAGRPALALDLMEEFRPLIVDSVVVELLNHRVLTPADFVEKVGAYQLKSEKRAIFFTKFEERLNEEVQHPLFGYRTSYRRCLELQARLLAKTSGQSHLMNPIQNTLKRRVVPSGFPSPGRDADARGCLLAPEMEMDVASDGQIFVGMTLPHA